jgi:cell division protease FtsH
MGALGYVMHVPEDEKYLNSQAELHDMIVGLLGGRAAEEIVFDTVTTGASNDIEKATSIARSMVTRYGMSKRFGLMGLETVESQYLEGRTSMNCADHTAAEVDNEVMGILKECYGEALGLLRENREVMDKIADHLIAKETITGKEFMKIYREAKGLPEPEEKPKESKTGEINLEKPEERQEDKLEEKPEEKPQEQPQPQEPPIWQRQCEPQNPCFQNPQPQADVDAQPQKDGEESGDNGDYSQFGSAWDQNVNGRQ